MKKREAFIEAEEDVEDIRKSKSQVKREMHALQTLGERLTGLSDEQLRRLDIPDELHEAIAFARTLTSHGARHRHIQRIGVIMRHIDPEPLERALNYIDQQHLKDAEHFREIEIWRERIVSGDDDLIEELVRDMGADRQKLRQLALNARKEAKDGKPPKTAKNLFRYLREVRENGKS